MVFIVEKLSFDNNNIAHDTGKKGRKDDPSVLIYKMYCIHRSNVKDEMKRKKRRRKMKMKKCSEISNFTGHMKYISVSTTVNSTIEEAKQNKIVLSDKTN